MDKLATPDRVCEVLLFAPDPYVDRRLPLGAVITDHYGVRVVLTEHAPDWRCCGGWQGAALAEQALNALQEWQPSEGGVPQGFEDILHRDAEMPVPGNLLDEQICKLLWGSAQPGKPRGVQARTLGRDFFRSRGVGPYVRENFDPRTAMNGRFRAAAAGGNVTQYVTGKNKIVLLEPVRRDASEQSVAETIKRLAVWQHATTTQRSDWPPITLVAYSVAEQSTVPSVGQSPLLSSLGDFADRVFDTLMPRDASMLVDVVKEAVAA
jgi:hypothetical protein